MNSRVCVDASLIVRTLVPEPSTEQALALLAHWRQEEAVLVAPALLHLFERWFFKRRSTVQ